MKRKAIVLFKWSLLKGGAEKQLLLLYKYLNGQGYSVKVLTNQADEKLIEIFSAREDLLLFKSFLDLLKTLSNLRKGYTLVLHVWDHKSSVYGFVLAKLLRLQFIDGSVRSAPSRSMKHYRLYEFKYKLFSWLRVKIVSNTKAGLASYGLRDSKNTYVVHNGISTNILVDDIELSDGFRFRVGMVANMRWKKDFATFIEAGKKVLQHNSQVGFYLIGDGEYRYLYAKMASDSSHKDNFIFTGAESSPLELIKQMNVCVLCNVLSGEGLSNSIMEYMLCKKPVIATNIGGNPELVVDGITGYLIAEQDSSALASHIESLLNNSGQARLMGEKGFERISSVFDVPSMCNAYLSIYTDKKADQ